MSDLLDPSLDTLAPLSLTPQQQKDLRLQARRVVGRVCERIHLVLLFARGFKLWQIALLYELDERTICAWIERYRQHGLEGLHDRPAPGDHE